MRALRVLGMTLLLAPGPARAAATVAPADSMPVPRAHGLSFAFDAVEKSLVHPVARALDPALAVRQLAGRRREASNVDESDRVRLPSTWWQPRVGYKAVTPEDVRNGPGSGTGPAPGPWTVTQAKTAGASKGFQIQDSRGDRYIVKFDPPAFPELASGADVVASKLYWAAGYNVPDNAIAFFRRESLVVSPQATVTIGGKKVKLTGEFLDRILVDVPPPVDGRYRVVASRLLAGRPLGEWRFDGRLADDVEDRIPHQSRREVRGLWVISAWLNNTDCSARNTLDMYVADGGRAFVRHYLIDFNGCLGSGSIAPQTPRDGHEYFFDYGAIARKLVTLGLPRQRWESGVDPGLSSVGCIESAVFDPAHWKPYIPNPAFDERTARDIAWGARIVARFTDEQIRAAVECGRYSDPRATAYLVQVLAGRRDAIARQWLGTAARLSSDGGAGIPRVGLLLLALGARPAAAAPSGRLAGLWQGTLAVGGHDPPAALLCLPRGEADVAGTPPPVVIAPAPDAVYRAHALPPSPRSSAHSALEHGTLFLVGGGSGQRDLADRFVHLAGGASARILDLPDAAMALTGTTDPPDPTALAATFGTRIVVLHATSRAQADSESFTLPFQRVRGVWIDGGEAAALVGRYMGTRTEKALVEFLDRGGVIGGTSAGAKIWGSHVMVFRPGAASRPYAGMSADSLQPGDPHEPVFGVLRNVVIVPHFAEFKLADAVRRMVGTHPGILAVGIDEATAFEVHRDVGIVRGRGHVTVFDGNRPDEAPLVLSDGEHYDLSERRVPGGSPPGQGRPRKSSTTRTNFSGSSK